MSAQARTEQARALARSLLEDPSHASSSTDELAAAHPDLMPELGDELRKLARIRRAFARATSSADGLDAGQGPAAELPGEALPGYAIVGEIHRGGQGVVYRAIQNTTQREVAIKVLRDGPFAGGNDLLRFDQEVRILAGLDHPNIVTIHDRGKSGARDYFVMDYVPGQSLDEHVATADDGKRLNVRGTLELWAEVCEAVEAAHLRGVMHRDLKPGNVRVTPDGRPRVLDFGLAKTTSDDDSEAAQAMTNTGQFLGTLPWASPEQAEGRWDDTDVRTDVYALGVIGYQLLTGGFPYRVQGPALEVVERIRTATPPPVSRARTECDDEVDTIVARCLAKEPERRYQNAGELARDIRRYLGGQPIAAKRDSSGYILRKLIARHRVLVASAATVFFVVMGSAAALTVQNQQLRESRAAEQRAAATANQVSDFLQEAISASDPLLGDGQNATVTDLLHQTAAHIDFALNDDPAVRVPVQRTIGISYMNLGDLEEARRHLQASYDDSLNTFGPRHPESLRSLRYLIELERNSEDFTAAEDALEEAFTLVDADDPTFLDLQILSAQLYYERGQDAPARTAIDEVLEVLAGQSQRDPRQEAEARNLSGLLDLRADDLPAASDAFELAYASYRSAFGAAHPTSAMALSNIARVATLQEDYAEALNLCQSALQELLEKLGPDHIVTIRVQQNLAALLLRSGDNAAARPILEAIIERDHPGAAAARASALNNLARIVGDVGSSNSDKARTAREESAELYEKAIGALQDVYGPLHADVATAHYNVANTVIPLSDLPRATEHLEACLAIREQVLPAGHADIARAQKLLARCYLEQRRFDNARATADAWIDSHNKGGRLDEAVNAARLMTSLFLKRQRTDDALHTLDAAIELLKDQDAPRHVQLREQLQEASRRLRSSD